MAEAGLISTPDQRVRVFVSSSSQELEAETAAARDAVTRLRLVPVLPEQGASPHSPVDVYRAYLAQSQVFVGIYWQGYGRVVAGEQTSLLEDQFQLADGMPRLIYVKSPAPERHPRLAEMLAGISHDGGVSYRSFSTPGELRDLIENDLAVLLTERFDRSAAGGTEPADTEPAGTESAGTGSAATGSAGTGSAGTGPAVLAAGSGVAVPAPRELPAPTTPLVGRRQETADVSELVLHHGARLVTFTGPGGVGKTRLALESARQLGPGFADGVRLVDLSSVTDPGFVAAAIAGALGLSTAGGALTADLKQYLRTRRHLLVLDNFEAVTAAAPLVAELLAAAPGLAVLVTSRTLLRLSGEHEFPVATLAVPEPGTDADGIGDSPSVRLFVQRARASAARFELTGGNAAAIGEICRRLDGLPLAIELVAAKVRLLPPEALLDRLTQPMDLLTGGARDLPERQRTLRNTLDWSLRLLPPAEQALFARLGVCAGTFDLACATAVSSDPAGSVLDTLGSLVDSSLVRAEYRDDEPRFWMLGTIRGYAREQLRASGAWRETHDRHTAHFLALAQPSAAELQGPEQLAWARRLEIEHDNLQAAMCWLVDPSEPHDPELLRRAVHVTWATWRFWWLLGHAEEIHSIGEQLLDSRPAQPPRERAMLLSGAGFGRLTFGDQAGAQEVFEQSLPLFRQVGDNLNLALALAALGHISALHGRDQRASELLEESLALSEGDNGELSASERFRQALDLALGYNFLGQLRLSQHDNDGAGGLFAKALGASGRAQDRLTILMSLYDLALASRAEGELTRAQELLDEGLALAAEAGDETSAAYYLECLSEVAGRRRDPDRAVRLMTAAACILQRRGTGWLHAWVPRAPHGEAVMDGLRSDLDDAAFAEARAWGMSADAGQAIEYALSPARASAGVESG